MTVHQLLHSLPSPELTEWRAFLRLRAGLSEFPKSKPEDIKAVFKGMAKALGGGKKGGKKGSKKKGKKS